jgi:hypothetical protein
VAASRDTHADARASQKRTSDRLRIAMEYAVIAIVLLVIGLVAHRA